MKSFYECNSCNYKSTRKTNTNIQINKKIVLKFFKMDLDLIQKNYYNPYFF